MRTFPATGPGRRATILVAIVAATGVLTACADSLVEGGLPLTVSIVADRSSAAVGQTVVYTVEASGTNLVGLTIDYGDGVADSVPTSGAVTAGITREHAYAEGGTFVARATVVDFQNFLTELTDSVTVQIFDPGT